MALVESQQAEDTGVLESRNPVSGHLVRRFPVHDRAAARDAVERARVAGAWWWALGYDERRRRLGAFRSHIARRLDALVRLMEEENGKTAHDAFLETMLALDQLAWAARSAKRVLRNRPAWPTIPAANHIGWVEQQPFGVVAVLGPWNFPVYTPMSSIGYALAAGNAVVYKPSEHATAVGAWLVEAFADAVPEQPVLQLVSGFAETGQALCTAGADLVAFTGSGRVARKVMAACAETLTPVIIEGGGKDAVIVDDDADVREAAAATTFGSFHNAGQACVATEVVYATEAVHDRFVAAVVDQVQRLHADTSSGAALGPITVPSQVEVVHRHVNDALERGARALVGGPESVRPPFIDPVVLVDVPPDALVLREETFGPVLPIVRVRDADEAVARANSSGYALGSAVFARRRGVELARRLQAGMTSINGVYIFAALPGLPFGGRGESGFGRVNGPEGLRAFARPKAITRKWFTLPGILELARPDPDPRGVRVLKRLVRLRHGGTRIRRSRG